MVDSAEGAITKMFDPEKKQQCVVDGESQQHSPTLMVATDAVSKVLEDDDLLREILVRLGLPTTLVSAALVCKRWLEHASDRKFLSRFRKLHPPRFLGYYITEGSKYSEEHYTHFVQMLPQPPELAAIIRRIKSYNFGGLEIIDCRSGSILTRRSEGGIVLAHVVHRPLCPERSMDNVPPLPRDKATTPLITAILSKQEGGKSSYLYLMGELAKESTIGVYMSQDSTKWLVNTTTSVYMLQDGVWRMHASVTCQLPSTRFHIMPVLVDNKIYMSTAFGDEIMVLDWTASSFSKIKLPQGVKCDDSMTMLPRAGDASGVYLIHVKEFQLRIWPHKGDNWLLLDTFCLQEMRACLETLDLSLEGRYTSDELEDEDIHKVYISRAGDDCQFVFLRMEPWIFYLDIKSRRLCKVYDNNFDDRYFAGIRPFMMIWPPTFPALKEGPARLALSVGAGYNNNEILLGFISIGMAGFLHWLAKPITTLLLYPDLGPAIPKRHRRS